MSIDISERFKNINERYYNLTRGLNLEQAGYWLRSSSEDTHKMQKSVEQFVIRKYFWASDLKERLQDFATECKNEYQKLKHNIEKAEKEFEIELKELKDLFKKLDEAQTQAALDMKQIDDFEKKLSNIEKKVDVYDFKAEYRILGLKQAFQRLVDRISEMLDRRDQASFSFSSEHLLLSDEAEWLASGKAKDNIHGFIYLTDKRLIFEQKETTNKLLGLFGGKKTQELKWEMQLSSIDSVSAEFKSGFWDNTHIIHIKTQNASPSPRIEIRIKNGLNGDFWADQIRRIINNDNDGFYQSLYEYLEIVPKSE